MKIITKAISAVIAICLSASMLFSGCVVETGSPSSAETTAAQTTESTTLAETTVDTTTQPKSDRQEPLMWKVTGNDGSTMYLFGTIHIGDERNKQIMENITSKVDECDALAVECDTVAYQNDFQAMVNSLSYMMYLDGTTVRDHLDAEQYEKCEEYLSKRNLYNKMYDMYHPSLWYQLLQQAAVADSPYDSDNAMDTMLINHANDNGKTVLEVESVDAQYKMLDSFSDELYSLLIDAFFENESKYSESLTELYEAWLVGDEEKLTKLVSSEEEEDEELTKEQEKLVEEYNEKMYTERNLGMVEKAQEYLKGGQTVFFAVGTAHMLGDTGLVKQLTDKGYTVEKITI